MVKLGFFLLVRGAWIKKPANLDLVLAAGECICKDDKASAALQMARGKLLSSDAFFAFLRLFYSEWALLKWLDESGSKF